MTIAARTDCGRFVVSPGRKSSNAAIVSAPMRPASCVCAPAWAATGVRDALALIGNPEKNAVPRFAAPRARSSWSWSTRSPARAAKLRDSTLVSAMETTAIARPPASIDGQFVQGHAWDTERRQPLGQRSHDGHAGGGSESQDAGQ